MKQLKNEKLKSSIPLTTNAKILHFVVDIQLSNYRNGFKSISANLTEELIEYFGKPNFIKNLVKRTHIWIIEYDGIKYNIFSAKEKGTTFEIVTNLSYEDIALSEEYAEKFISFLTEFNNKIIKLK